MSNSNGNQEPKPVEESPPEQRSLRDLFVDQVRRLLPPRCSTTQAGPSAGGTSENTTSKIQPAKCSTQNSEPNVTVLHVRASVQRTNPVTRHRPPDFSEQVYNGIFGTYY